MYSASRSQNGSFSGTVTPARPSRFSMAGPLASPSKQSPWKGQAPGNGSHSRLCGMRMCPISGASMPTSGLPSLMYPPPIPVPIVRYNEGSQSLLAPQIDSPSPAALTSVSIAIGTSSPRCKVPRTSTLLQCGLGVGAMDPYIEDLGSRSRGPKHPTPIERILPAETKGRKN